MRQIDKILNSFGKQVLWLIIVTVAVFTLLLLPKIFCGTLAIVDYVFAFINPGSTFKSDVGGFEQVWMLVVGIIGMILLGGLLISVFNNILQNRIDKVKNGMIHYRFSDHVIVIGYNKMAISLIRQIYEKYPKSEIVLQTVQTVPDIRHELYANLLLEIEKRVSIVAGNRTSKEDLEKLRPQDCKAIFLLGEMAEYDHDTLNIKALELLRDILKQQKQKDIKPCHVLFEYQSTYALFQQQDIPCIKDCLDFLPFNFHECWAQKVLVDGDYPFLDREPITAESTKHIHLVIAGMSQMGVAIGIQAAHICHFPNFVTHKGKIKTKITFIDENADREKNFLQGRFRHLFDEKTKKFIDIEFEFIQDRIENPAIQKQLAEWAKTDDKLLTVAICFSSSPAAIAAGLYLPDEIYENEIPVFVRQETSDCTLSLLSAGKYKNVKPFGMLDHAYDIEKADSLLPMAVNYVYDFYYNHHETPKSIIDEKDLKILWQKLMTVKKWSNRYNANMLMVKKRSFGIEAGKNLDSKTIELLAEVEHNRWNIEELLLGFRPTTAEEKKIIGKSSAKKETYKAKFVHNDICPYKKIADTDDEKIKNTKEYDICLSESIPLIIKYIKDKAQ